MKSACAAALAAICIAPAHAQTIERMRLTDNDLNCTQIYAEVQQMESMVQLAGSSNAPGAAPGQGRPPAPAPAAAPDAQTQALAAGLAGLLGGPAGQPGGAVPAGLMPNQNGIPAAALSDPRVQASIARARAAGYSDAQINAAMQMGAARAGYPVGAALAAQPQAAAAAPQAAPAIGGLFGALAGSNAGGAQAANLFGGLVAAQAAQPPQAPAVTPVPAPAPVARPAGATPNASLAAQAQARKEHLTGLFLSRGCKLADVKK